MMRLQPMAADWLVDRFASRLNGGTLRIYSDVDQVLAEFFFQNPAFAPAAERVAEAHPLTNALIQATGEAVRAELVTISEEVLADVRVLSVDAPDPELGDIFVDRTDFHRGGACVLSRVTLSLPLRP